MLASIIGAIANKQSGGSAIKGAITGKAAMMGLRFLGPVAGTAALGFAAYKGWAKHNKRKVDTAQNAEAVNDDNAAALGSAAISNRAA